ncbi:MAG: hypothetical protein JFR41_10805 [Muribaculaceae bacterium]|nr:hypothetical protein [Muribaculaceae bacterium]
MKVFIIGYPTMGESIVTLFIDKGNDNAVLYSCVIDSFYRKDKSGKNHNETIEILKRFNVSALNLLCWSHPDFDHSRGLDDIISSYCNGDSQIILPMHVHGKPYENISYNAIDRPIIQKIVALNAKNKRTFLSVCAGNRTRYEVADFNFIDFPDGNHIPVAIHAHSPSSSFLNDRIENDQPIKKNELSIFLTIEVDSNRFLFCGDTENEAIEQINTRHIINPLLVKIPHHSSESSDVLLNMALFSKKKTCACTTAYKRGKRKLPDDNVLSKYVEQCKMVHYTGEDTEHNVGVVEYSFTPYDFAPNGEPCSYMVAECHGNAKII